MCVSETLSYLWPLNGGLVCVFNADVRSLIFFPTVWYTVWIFFFLQSTVSTMGKTIFMSAIMCFEWDCNKGRLTNYSRVFLPLVCGKASWLTSICIGQKAVGEQPSHTTPERLELPHWFQMTCNSWMCSGRCCSSLRDPMLCLMP